jgi:protein-S-isoprenylcysteine O-methyltransferase Ste14
MRLRAVLGSVLYLILAPGTVAGLVPWWISKWKVQPVSPAFLIIQLLGLLLYAALGWLVSHLFVVIYEEPTLRRTFGDEYDAFCANVPRWIPRLRPWMGPVGRGG